MLRPTANGEAPPDEPSSRPYYADGSLITVLWPRDIAGFKPGGPGEIRAAGRLAMEFPVWRGKGVVGDLVIEGRSLVREGLRMTGEVPEGYGREGLQASALVFTEPGCWQVTAPLSPVERGRRRATLGIRESGGAGDARTPP